MKPIKFEQANKNLLKPESMTDEECSSLWVYNDGRECISCWRLTWKERIKALLFGRVWLSVLSGRTQPPVWLTCCKTICLRTSIRMKSSLTYWTELSSLGLRVGE